MSTGHNSVAADRLRSFIERIEHLEEEKASIANDIKEVKSEAKAAGFDVKTINEIVKLRKMGESEREEREALLDIYKAALGMLYDTPLGEAARKRLSQPKRPPNTDRANPRQSDLEDYSKPAEEPPSAPAEPPPTDTTVEEARAMGRAAAEAGKPVTDNPFPARDPRRAAWDEAWCSATGSDGMDLPESWKRSKKRKGDDTPTEEAAPENPEQEKEPA